ncbi:MAG: phosphoribosylglycinamide formyltransferase [Oscillospiraceae bacterium]|nr:phosphoribosylglycinamide formyltransferase [Oscillospiraceae bacterium]
MLNRPKALRVAVLVSGGGTNLQAILDARGTVIQNAEIVLVVSSQPEAYALERARLANIPAVTISKKELGSQEAFESALTQALSEYRVDLIVLAGFLTILSPAFTRRFDRRIINVHPSLIPSFCGKGFYGLRVHEAALERGVKVTGATVHYVNEIPDGGEIILQKAVPILPGDDPKTLQRRVMEQAEWVLLPQALQQIAETHMEINHK